MNILKEHKKTKYNFNKVGKVLSLLVSLVVFSEVIGAAELTSLRYTNLPGDKVQIHLDTNGSLSEPGVFSTTDPARVAFDFFGVSKKMPESLFKVGVGNVESVVSVETNDRTRVIVNLLESTAYTSQFTSTGYVITLDGPSVGMVDVDNGESAMQQSPFAENQEFMASKSINSVDFRRTKNGGGKISVVLSDPSLLVNVKDSNGKINVNFSNSNLVYGLEKSLDVLDFATPVESVDVFQDGANARIVVNAKPEYRQVSYQSGNEFTLIVDPYVESEQEKRERQDSVSKFKGEKLSINFQKIEVRAALSVIADFTGINIVTSDDVKGELTLSLKDVPWDQALDVILKTKGLGKRESGEDANKVIFIAPAAKLAKDDAAAAAALLAAAKVEPLVSEIIKINFADAEVLRDVLLGDNNNESKNKDESVATVINLGGDSPGLGSTAAKDTNSQKTALRVTADKRSNSLIVTTNYENLKAIKTLIKKLDTPLRQVLIETRIVEANDSFSKSLGAKLGFKRVTENPQVPGSSSKLADRSVIGATDATAFGSLIDDDGSALRSFANNVDLGAVGSSEGRSPASYALQLFKAGRGYSNVISLELSALEAEGGAKIVASPRIVATDNQKSVIRQGEERVLTSTVSEEGEGGGSTSKTKSVVQTAFLKLEVTPKITPDDRVVLNVMVSQDVFTNDNTVNRKDVETQVLLENGETIVIGGIFQESERETINKVPVLGDIPVVRNLFRVKTNESRRTELMIFLTPKLINNSLSLD